MGKIISASIDLTKIDKSKIKEHKNGSKYYSIQIFLNDEQDKYDNDVSIANSQTKEEREAKVKKVYIGNGKTVWSKDAEVKPVPVAPTPTNNSLDEPPF